MNVRTLLGIFAALLIASITPLAVADDTQDGVALAAELTRSVSFAGLMDQIRDSGTAFGLPPADVARAARARTNLSEAEIDAIDRALLLHSMVDDAARLQIALDVARRHEDVVDGTLLALAIPRASVELTVEEHLDLLDDLAARYVVLPGADAVLVELLAALEALMFRDPSQQWRRIASARLVTLAANGRVQSIVRETRRVARLLLQT